MISYSKLFKKAVILFLILSLATSLSGQEVKLVYHVIHNGNVIGQMQLHRRVSGPNTYLQLKSQVKTRFVLPINVQTIDQSQFSNGKLLYSDVYRTVNGKEKENKKTRLLNNRYQLQAGSKFGQIDQEIDYNMMSLYCREPVNISQVYSDNFQQFLSIKKLNPHTYRINLPDGNYNDYHFENGTCRMVNVYHGWYTITMKLV